MASWQFTCVGHGGGRKCGSIADTVMLSNPCAKKIGCPKMEHAYNWNHLFEFETLSNWNCDDFQVWEFERNEINLNALL